MKTAVIIGSGPAGLMAADELSRAGAKVTVIEAKPSLGRKFLMAGKSGLNLTKDEPLAVFAKQFSEAGDWLSPMLSEFGPHDMVTFAKDLEQDVFTGSSGRVFPNAMKASPFLRSWIQRLTRKGVEFQTRWSWQGWQDANLLFDAPDGPQSTSPDVTVFALGGGSWARLGSDGKWADIFQENEIEIVPFGASNAALSINWTSYMQPHFGTPLKGVSFSAGSHSSRGEAVVSSKGLEGGGIYSVSRGIREGHDLFIDLKPDWTLERVQVAIEQKRGKATLTNHLRRSLKMKKHELALLNEFAHSLLQDMSALAKTIKALPIKTASLRPIDEAISTSGGVPRFAFDEHLMLTAKPGTFCAGEMLDWEAPTGGYLLTACFATGRTAGRGAARYLGLSPTPGHV